MTSLMDRYFKSLELPLALFYLFYFAMVGVFVIFMPKVLKDLGYSSVEIGAIYTTAPLMRFFLPFIFKHFVELNQRVYFISLSATFIVTLLFFVAIDSFVGLLIVTLLFGGAMGACLPFVETIAIEQIGKERYGKIRLWGSIGFALVAFVLGNILDNYKVALIAISIMAFWTMIFGFIIAKFDRGFKSDSAKEDTKSFSLFKYWAFWTSIFLFQFSFGGFYNFFTIYETSNGVPLDIVSYLWIFGVVCEIVMLTLQGPLLAKFDLLDLLWVATFSGVIRWLLVAFFPENIVIMMLAQATHALSFALYYTASIAYVYRLYTQKRLAQQFYLGISFGLGGAVGAIVSGVIYDITPSGLFVFEAFMALLAVVLLFVHKRRAGV